MYSRTNLFKTLPLRSATAFFLALLLSACTDPTGPVATAPTIDDGTLTDERGPNNGRLLRSGDFMLELTIFETGVPPEYRAWATMAGQPVDPSALDMNVKLTRLGGVVD
ncbi:MAG: secretion protein HlyD, partial [Pseudohongiella sp.]|nr:secretion protein HlyD [Pseudohongiella sp.]